MSDIQDLYAMLCDVNDASKRDEIELRDLRASIARRQDIKYQLEARLASLTSEMSSVLATHRSLQSRLSELRLQLDVMRATKGKVMRVGGELSAAGLQLHSEPIIAVNVVEPRECLASFARNVTKWISYQCELHQRDLMKLNASHHSENERAVVSQQTSSLTLGANEEEPADTSSSLESSSREQRATCNKGSFTVTFVRPLRMDLPFDCTKSVGPKKTMIRFP